jgi:hypothetical protein
VLGIGRKEYYFRIDLRETGWEGVDWILLALIKTSGGPL